MRGSMNSTDLVHEMRLQLGLTQEDFAARLRVTLPTINLWGNGRTKPSPLVVQSIRSQLLDMGDAGQILLAKFFSDEEQA